MAQSEKREKYIIPLMVTLLGLENRAALARLLGVSEAFLSKVASDSKENEVVFMPKGRLKQLVLLCAQLEPPVDLSLEDFNLPKEQLIDRIPSHHPRYRDARAAAGLSPVMQSENTFSPLTRLYGKYARLLIARAKDGKSSTLVLENLEIEPDKTRTESATITQYDYEFENRKPVGSVRVRGYDTIEIAMNYGSGRDPIGTFLAPLPGGHQVDHILAIALDIKYRTRYVVSKPVLFIRLEHLFDKKDRFGPTTALYKKVRSIFKKSIVVDNSRIEMFITPFPLHEDIAEVQEMLLTLQSGSGNCAAL